MRKIICVAVCLLTLAACNEKPYEIPKENEWKPTNLSWANHTSNYEVNLEQIRLLRQIDAKLDRILGPESEH